jgi:glycerol-3-phosphate acyltransferase PlsY
MPYAWWPFLLAGAYLLGAIPFAQVMARINGTDLRTAGTGNVGAGNLTRVVGWQWGAVAGILDGLKGVFPVLIAKGMGLGPGAAGFVGVMAVVGHNWSIFLRGRSGRGLATSAGMLLGLDPVLLFWTAGWSFAGWKIGGGVAGFLGWGLLPFVSVAMGRPFQESLVLLLLLTVIVGRRMQGNVDSPRGLRPALIRAVYDSDPVMDDLTRPSQDPLYP